MGWMEDFAGSNSPWLTTEPPPIPTVTALTAKGSPGDARAALVSRRGGDTLTIEGTNFTQDVEVYVMQGNYWAPTGFKKCHIVKPSLDITNTKIHCVTPALPDGSYRLRIHFPGLGFIDTDPDLDVALFSYETKVMSTRGGFAKPWRTGAKFLSSHFETPPVPIFDLTDLGDIGLPLHLPWTSRIDPEVASRLDGAGNLAYAYDLSENGNHWVQPTASKRPSIFTTASGKKVYRFDGTDDFLQAVLGANFTIPDDYMIWMVAQVQGGGGLDHIWSMEDGGVVTERIIYDPTPNEYGYTVGSDSVLNVNFTNPDIEAGPIELYLDATSYPLGSLVANGTVISSAASGVDSAPIKGVSMIGAFASSGLLNSQIDLYAFGVMDMSTLSGVDQIMLRRAADAAYSLGIF